MDYKRQTHTDVIKQPESNLNRSTSIHLAKSKFAKGNNRLLLGSYLPTGLYIFSTFTSPRAAVKLKGNVFTQFTQFTYNA